MSEEKDTARNAWLGEGQLRQPKLRKRDLAGTEKAIRTSKVLIEKLWGDADAAVLRDIELHLLIAAGQLQVSWDAPAETIEEAPSARHLFAIDSPIGGIYFPEFFAGSRRYNRSALAEICIVLRDISGRKKYCFFISNRCFVLRRTSLEVL